MSIGFANAGLLGLLALGAVPLLIHLFARQRPPVAAFPSIQFLEKALRQTVKMRKPQSWLLLALRTLAVLALAAAFARPLYFGDGKTASTGEARHAVVVVDASASMAAVEGGRSRFDLGCDEAVGILRGLAPGDSADVVWMGPRAEAVLPELGRNTGFLETALATAEPTRGRGDAVAAMDLAAALLADVVGEKEIYVVSDFQATGWEGVSLASPPNITVATVRAGDGSRLPNLAVTSVVADPPAPLAGETVRVSAKVENFSGEPLGTTVFFEAGPVRKSQQVLVPAGGSGDVVFTAEVVGNAALPVEVSIAEDSFGADDRRHAVVRPAGKMRVAVVSGSQPETAKAWERAVRAFGWAEVVALEEGDVDVAFFAGWEGEEFTQILEDRGTVVVLPEGIERNADGFRVKVAAPESDLLEIFRDGAYGEPVGEAFIARAPGVAKGVPLLAFGDGAPALSCETGVGQTYTWSMLLGPGETAWPSTPGFLTFVGELLFQARDFAAQGEIEVPLLPGDSLLWTSEQNFVPGEVTLQPPGSGEDAIEVEAVLAAGGGTDLVGGSAVRPGVYHWEISGETARLDVVGFPVGESDLAGMDAPEVVGAEETGFVSAGELRERREGSALWGWLVGIVAVLVFFETLTLYFGSRRKPVSS